MSEVATEAARRRTFAIISHPDAGKTTLTEKLLLFGGAIQMAGSVKGRKAARHATSDWMALEKERGISVTSSVMQFPYEGRIVNLLDTPGHADFSEDTYRMLTAVDSALMVIDVRQGRRGAHHQADGGLPPARHADHDLHQQARPRRPRPDRPARRSRERARHPVRAGDLADRHGLAPEGRRTTWSAARCTCTNRAATSRRQDSTIFASLDDPALAERLGDALLAELRDELELVQGASHPFDLDAYLRRQADAGVLRLGGQQLRRAAAAGFLRRPRAVAAAARHHHPRT